MTFSQDEINLMCIYDTSDKTELLKELRFSVPYIEDTELKEITETVIDKLERMTNDEFSKLELDVYKRQQYYFVYDIIFIQEILYLLTSRKEIVYE